MIPKDRAESYEALTNEITTLRRSLSDARDLLRRVLNEGLSKRLEATIEVHLRSPGGEGKPVGFGPYDSDPKGHDFDPVTRTCRICHLSVGTVGVTGPIPCFTKPTKGKPGGEGAGVKEAVALAEALEREYEGGWEYCANDNGTDSWACIFGCRLPVKIPDGCPRPLSTEHDASCPYRAYRSAAGGSE